MTPLLLLPCLAVATASMAVTLTKTPMFNFVREWLPEDGKLQELWGCPYCMSHWVAAFWILIYRPTPFLGSSIDLLLSWFMVVTLNVFLIQGILILGSVVSILKKIQETQE